METDINATCRMQGYYHLSTKASAPGTVVAGRGRQKCSDLLELRPGFDGGTGPSACDPHRGRNRGSVLSVHLACPPPKPPLSALLQLALSFTTDTKVHRMNWVSHALRPPLACALCPRPCARAHAPIRAAVPSAGAYSSSGGGRARRLSATAQPYPNPLSPCSPNSNPSPSRHPMLTLSLILAQS